MSSRSSTIITLPFRIAFGSLALLGAVALAAPQSASAYSATGTAANTVITTTATVAYNDAGGVAQAVIPVTATVTVTQVKANPTLSAPIDQTVDPGGNAVYTYTITANSNGNDNYTLAVPSVVNSVGISTASTGVLSTLSINNLGSTIVAVNAAAGATVISVPSDGVAGTSVNGISATDTVLIGGVVYTVASVSDLASGTSTITLTVGLAAPVTLGDAIYEQSAPFTLTVTPGTVVATANQTVTTTISAQYNGAGSTVTDETITTVQVAALTVAKVVSTDGATGAVYAGMTSSVPGSIVTYRITILNGGAGIAKAVTITDPISAYTSFNTSSCKVTTNAANTTYASAGATITDGACGYAAGTITYPHGDLAAGATVILYFQATIK